MIYILQNTEEGGGAQSWVFGNKKDALEYYNSLEPITYDWLSKSTECLQQGVIEGGHVVSLKCLQSPKTQKQWMAFFNRYSV